MGEDRASLCVALAALLGGAHLEEDAVEPLERAVEVELDPARRRRDRLTTVVRAPALQRRVGTLNRTSRSLRER